MNPVPDPHQPAVTCPSCGTANTPGSRYCVSCGSALAATCPNCGTPLPPDVRFCPACGTPIEPASGRPADTSPHEERRLVTVLFSDVVGSTTLGERLDPEHYREVMESYFRAMRGEIEHEGGTIEKFIGDAIMAVFGVPTVHEDDAARALRAALRMRGRQGELNRVLFETHGVSLGMRIGINTGDVVAVNDPRPGEGMVIGDTVNVAARLETLAEPNEILVGGRTHRAVRGFDFEDRGSHQVKGRRRPVAAYELVGSVDEPARGIPGTRVPMVGRDQEMGLLDALFARVVSEGRPHLVTLYGDPGVGKSRLAAEFEDVASRRPGTQVVRGRCLPSGGGVAYWPLAEILKRRSGVLDSDGPIEAVRKVRKAAGEVLAKAPPDDPDRTVAALAFTVGLAEPSSPFEGMEPRQVRFEAHAAWRAYFSALAALGPVVVTIEDIHWADPSFLDLLEELAERTHGPLLFLCPARLELTKSRPGWGGGRRNYSSISLEPLVPAEAARLMDLLVTDRDMPAAPRQRILLRAEGNPFFLEEIVRQLIDEGRIERSGDRLRVVGPINEVDIPDSVQAVLAARIDLLDPGDRRAVQAASVVGRIFWPTPVRELLDGEAGGLEEALRRLQDRELVRARLTSTMGDEGEYIFTHILTRDVAYQTLTRRDRARAHGLVAGWLERTAGDRRREFSDQLAHHYVEAFAGQDEHGPDAEGREGLRRKAVEYLLLASEEARSKLALDRAERLGERALDLARGDRERSLAEEALGEAYLLAYWGDRAWHHLRRAADAAVAAGGAQPAPADRRRIARLSARALESPTRWGAMLEYPGTEEARRYLDLAVAMAPEERDSELTVRVLTARAMWPNEYAGPDATVDDFAEARAAGEEAAAMAIRVGRADLASAALDAVGTSFYGRGLYGRMADVTRRRLELVPRLQDPREIEDTFAMAAWAAFHVGRYREAFGFADEGFGRSLAVAPAIALHSLEWRALARFPLGDWDGFFEDFDVADGLRGGREESPPGFISRPYAVGALIHEIRGQAEAAERLLARWPWRDQPEEAGRCAPWLALRAGLRGRPDEARQVLDHALSDPSSANRGLLLAARCDCLGASEAPDPKEVDAAVREARDHATEAGLLALLLHADRLEGRSALSAGDADRAVDLLARAEDGFAGLGARWEAARTALLLADAHRASGRQEPAGAAEARGRGVLRELGAVST